MNEMTYKKARKRAKQNPRVSYSWTDEHGFGRLYFCPIRGRIIAERSNDGVIWFK